MNIKKILKSCFAPVSALNKVIYKEPERVFFYSNLGFRDNVRALYDYMIENGLNEKFNITVATDEFELFKDSAPKNVRFVSLKKGIFPFLKSKYCFYSFGKYPIKPSKSQCVVNLWHGMPLKAIGRLEKGSENEDQNFFTKVIATSPFFADIMIRAFGADESQALITPQPRCDEFLKQTEMPKFLEGFDKIVLWMPTFMSSKRLGQCDGSFGEINPFDKEFLKNLSQTLVKNNMLLIIKPHPMDDEKGIDEKIENVLFLDEKDLSEKALNVYSLLKFTDALITDYSSIYFDYLLLDRPIAFVSQNSEDYKQNRGFAIDDISEFMPGYHIEQNMDFTAFLASVSCSEDLYSEKRKKCREVCNSCVGISGCERILKQIGLLKSEE